VTKHTHGFSHFRKEFSSTIAGKSLPFHTTLNAAGKILAFLCIKLQSYTKVEIQGKSDESLKNLIN
jgi:hypothetical protein